MFAQTNIQMYNIRQSPQKSPGTRGKRRTKTYPRKKVPTTYQKKTNTSVTGATTTNPRNPKDNMGNSKSSPAEDTFSVTQTPKRGSNIA